MLCEMAPVGSAILGQVDSLAGCLLPLLECPEWCDDSPCGGCSCSEGMASVQTSLKDGYELFNKGKFADALAAFQSILEMIPLTVAETRRDADDVKELLTVCREYHTGLRCEIERRKVPPTPHFPLPSGLHSAI